MIAYILNSTICLLALFIIYRLLLANEKCYRFNRFYLLGALVLGLALPSLDFFMGTNQFIVAPSEEIAGFDAQQITDLKKAPTILITRNLFPEFAEPHVSQVTGTTNSSFPLYTVLFFVYAFITLFLLCRYIYGIYSIYIHAKKLDHIELGTTKLKLSDSPVVPHTFMDNIFVNKQDYENGLISEQIIEHEMAHIKGFHTLDILFVELLKIIFWFNPAFYLFRKAILINHEYLADEQVLNSFKDVKGYQNQLLEVTLNHIKVNFASNLNFYLTKKRLLMMTKSKSLVRSSLKMGLLTPLVPLLILLFNTRVIDRENLSGAYETLLLADTVQVYENFKHLKWKTEEGVLFSGSNKMFDPKTGVLKRESIYDEGNLITQRSYTGLGQVFFNTVFQYDEGLPIMKTTSISGDLFSETIFITPANDYQGIQRYWDTNNGSLLYEEKYFRSDPNYLHSLVTVFDEKGNITGQERHANGKLVEKIK